MTKPSSWTWQAQRNILIVAVSVLLLVYEVVWGGGRAAVMTALTALLLSPVVMSLDEARRGSNGKGDRDA